MKINEAMFKIALCWRWIGMIIVLTTTHKTDTEAKCEVLDHTFLIYIKHSDINNSSNTLQLMRPPTFYSTISPQFLAILVLENYVELYVKVDLI
jgi:hypothetical protein